MAKSKVETTDADPFAPPAALLAFSVLLPRCLVGERYFVATDEADAFRQYRELGGVTSHVDRPIVKPLSVGSSEYAEAVKQHAAKTKPAEAVAP